MHVDTGGLEAILFFGFIFLVTSIRDVMHSIDSLTEVIEKYVDSQMDKSA